MLWAKDPWRHDPEGEVGRLESVLLRLPDVLAHLDPERLAQDVTEAAVELTGADFGACARVADPAPWVTVVAGGPVTLAQGPDPQRAPLLSASLAGAPLLRVDDLSRWAPTEEAARLYGTFVDGRMVRSYLAAPVTSRSGAVLGAVFLGHHQPRAFDERDERLVGGMSALLAVALDTAGLFQERERVATALQESLLPPLLPTVPGVDLAARYRATGAGNLVGGDFYDVFQTGEGDWAVVLGDVSGSGPEAAALTGLARYTVRAVAPRELQPSAVLRSLNFALGHQRADDRFCTAVYLRLRAVDGGVDVTVARAGHPPPMVLRDDGHVEVLDSLPGMPLGLFPDAGVGDQGLLLGPGDALVLYTDGVVEARAAGGDEFGQDGLRELLTRCAGRTADGIARRVELAAMDFQGGATRDDVAVVIVRAAPP